MGNRTRLWGRLWGLGILVPLAIGCATGRGGTTVAGDDDLGGGPTIDALAPDARTERLDGGPHDLALIVDGLGDLSAAGPADLSSVAGADLSVTPGADLAVAAGADLSGSVMDLAAAPPDLATARPDLATAPPDLAAVPPDLSMPAPDLVGVPGCGAGPPCGAGLTCCSGACVDLNTSVANCGGCGQACTLDYATAKCVSGACAIASCNSGFGDCDRRVDNGCEALLAWNDQNCGRCGNVCPSGGTGCSQGLCR